MGKDWKSGDDFKVKEVARPAGVEPATFGSVETTAVSIDSARDLPELAQLQIIIPADSIFRNCAKVPPKCA
jgi:hypothetical protein